MPPNNIKNIKIGTIINPTNPEASTSNPYLKYHITIFLMDNNNNYLHQN